MSNECVDVGRKNPKHPKNLKTKGSEKALDVLQEGRRVLETEAQAILELSRKLDQKFEEASYLMKECKGKVIVTGIGKSGQIGRKIASTLTSTGTPSFFLHPSESSHGDLGLVSQNDVLFAISQSGESEELFPLLNFSVRKGIILIGLTGCKDSTLGKASFLCLDTSVPKEACPFNLAPTSSSTLTLALGDALAMAVLKLRGFKREDYAQFHPGGSLGRQFLTYVEDLMHRKDLPLVSLDEDIKKVMELMSMKDVKGVAGVIDQKGCLVGVITDGDIRRFFKKRDSLKSFKALDVMSRHPKIIEKKALAYKALYFMEKLKIQSLFVVEEVSPLIGDFKPLGLIHFQDLLQSKL